MDVMERFERSVNSLLELNERLRRERDHALVEVEGMREELREARRLAEEFKAMRTELEPYRRRMESLEERKDRLKQHIAGIINKLDDTHHRVES